MHGGQDPWIKSLVKGDFYFRERKATPTASAPSVDKETVFRQSIGDSRQTADFRDYLARFPKGTFSRIAKRRITELEKKLSALLPTSYTIEDMDETLVALRSANARERPTASSAKVATLKRGSTVELTGKTQVEDKSWYRIAMSGRSAYVFGLLLGKKASPAVGV